MNPTTGHLFVATWDYANGGAVAEVDSASQLIIATNNEGPDAWGLAVNPSNGRVYVANHDSNAISILQDSEPSRNVSAPASSSSVGGIAEPPNIPGDISVGSRRSSSTGADEIGGTIAAGTLALATGGWYVRRRRRAG